MVRALALALILLVVPVVTVAYGSERVEWTIVTRHYVEGEPRPERFSGRASGYFDEETNSAMLGEMTQGYNSLRVSLHRDGLGIRVEIDVIRPVQNED